MKRRYEFIILGGVIAALSLFLVFRNRNRIQYELPDLQPLAVNEIDSITVRNAIYTVQLAKAGEKWQIKPEGYPVDGEKMQSILETIAGLKIVDLVSESKQYRRYDLDEKNRILVTAKKGEEILRQFYMGRTARSRHHTYLKLLDDDRVFHTHGNVRMILNEDQWELRDKAVLLFDKDSISEIVLDKEGQKVRLIKSEQLSSEVVWTTESGQVWDTRKVDDILTRTYNLKCQRWVRHGIQAENPVITLTFAGERQYQLTVFAKTDQEFPALSSEVEGLFILPYWIGDSLTDLLEEKAS